MVPDALSAGDPFDLFRELFRDQDPFANFASVPRGFSHFGPSVPRGSACGCERIPHTLYLQKMCTFLCFSLSSEEAQAWRRRRSCSGPSGSNELSSCRNVAHRVCKLNAHVELIGRLSQQTAEEDLFSHVSIYFDRASDSRLDTNVQGAAASAA